MNFPPVDLRGLQEQRVHLARRPALEKADLEHVRLHDLRHTAATLMLSEGIHPKIVQEMLGHANITMTLATYSHVLPTLQREATNRLDERFDRVRAERI